MKSRSYKNFDEALYKLSREIMLKPYDMVDYTVSHSAFVEDLILTMKSFDCTIDIGEFGYRINKWTITNKLCIDSKKLKMFYKNLQKINDRKCVYSFCDNENTPLLSIMLTRHDSRQKWKRAVVFIKEIELQRSLAVYFVFISVFLRELPDCCNVKEVCFHIGVGFISSLYANGLLDYYDLGLEELNREHPFVKDLYATHKTKFQNKEQISTYQNIKTMQELKFGLMKLSEIRVVDLELGV